MKQYNSNDRYYEAEFGPVPDEIKNIQLSKKATDILSGKHDNDPIDAKQFPVIAAMMKKIGKGHLVVNDE